LLHEELIGLNDAALAVAAFDDRGEYLWQHLVWSIDIVGNSVRDRMKGPRMGDLHCAMCREHKRIFTKEEDFALIILLHGIVVTLNVLKNNFNTQNDNETTNQSLDDGGFVHFEIPLMHVGKAREVLEHNDWVVRSEFSIAEPLCQITLEAKLLNNFLIGVDFANRWRVVFGTTKIIVSD
jgi:hypothetical protein